MCNSYSNREITTGAPVSRQMNVPVRVWDETWFGLRRRSRGRRESAAIWAGRRTAGVEHVEAVYFLDDYRGGVQQRGYHRVSVEALDQFFKVLQRDHRVIVADLHTHPGLWVGLSALDEENPIEFRVGFPAIVVPSFARPAPSLSLAGVHLYEGKGKWMALTDQEKEELFVFH